MLTVGSSVPQSKVGKVVGGIETAWAIVGLAGLPLVGLMIDKVGIAYTFLITGLLFVPFFIIFVFKFPRPYQQLDIPDQENQIKQMTNNQNNKNDEGQQQQQQQQQPHQEKSTLLREPSPSEPNQTMWRTLIQGWKNVVISPQCVFGLVWVLFMGMSSNIFFSIVGIWLDERYHLDALQLGIATIVFGVGELCGSLVVTFFGDRIGARKSLVLSTILWTLAYFLWAWIGNLHFAAALVCCFLIDLVFENTIVTSIGYFTRVLPSDAASVMTFYSFAIGLGKIIGVLVADLLWEWNGMRPVALVSCAITAVSLYPLWLGWNV